jgi:acyl-CoA thioester hydrolase
MGSSFPSRAKVKKAVSAGDCEMTAEHEITVRVRYADTDTMRVAYYANYFIWFESGRIELLRSKGIIYKDVERSGIFIPVIEAHANYKASARFDDELLIRTKIAKLGTTSIRFENEVYILPAMDLICTGHTVHVAIDKDGRPVRLPDELRAKLS